MASNLLAPLSTVRHLFNTQGLDTSVSFMSMSARAPAVRRAGRMAHGSDSELFGFDVANCAAARRVIVLFREQGTKRPCDASHL